MLLKNLLFLSLLVLHLFAAAQNKFQPAGAKKYNTLVSKETMVQVFNKIKTPYKYGIVFKHPDANKLMDSPTIFKKNGVWYMTYIVFDGKGYETWIAESKNLLDWKSLGKILSFSKDTWDANQKAGYMSLVDINWGGSYKVEKFNNKYWMSYLGGNTIGYEAGVLGVGMANNSTLTKPVEWQTATHPFYNRKILIQDGLKTKLFIKAPL